MAYQLKIAIRNIEPVIWRRIRLPGNITFQQLHQVIQTAFGWLDYHLYSFEFAGTVITVPDDDCDLGEHFGGKKELDAAKTIISEFFDRYDVCLYEYDFGDSWNHEIIVEKRLKESKKYSVPICLGGARERPPEDVGGTEGYRAFLEIISDKGRPEREDMLAWAEKDTRGRLYDPEYFCVSEINRRLRYALESDLETAVRMFSGQGISGSISWSGPGPYVLINGKQYSWEWLGDMLLRLGDGSQITIMAKVPRRR